MDSWACVGPGQKTRIQGFVMTRLICCKTFFPLRYVVLTVLKKASASSCDLLISTFYMHKGVNMVIMSCLEVMGIFSACNVILYSKTGVCIDMHY